jgi:hypothetical protein
MKNLLTKSMLVAALVGGATAAGVSTASAEIACNRAGECWHVDHHYNSYPPRMGIVIHDDGWREHHWGPHYHWHDHEGDNGYYDHGAWRPF